MRYRTSLAVFAVLLMATMAFGYTDATRPVYIDYTLCGATATTMQIPSNMYSVPGGSAVIMDSMRMAASLQCDTLSTTSGATFYDPMIYPLNGTVTLIIGIPAKPSANNTTYMKYFTPGDSYGAIVPGKWSSFIIWKNGTTDSTGATGYMVIGRADVPVTNMHLR
jgi:hypothetical protein